LEAGSMDMVDTKAVVLADIRLAVPFAAVDTVVAEAEALAAEAATNTIHISSSFYARDT